MVVAAAAVAMGVMHLAVIPARLGTSAATVTLFSVVLLIVGAALVGAAGYDLLRLREWGRRAVFVLLVLYAIGRTPALLRAMGAARDGNAAPDLLMFAASVAAAIYLLQPNVKRAFRA